MATQTDINVLDKIIRKACEDSVGERSGSVERPLLWCRGSAGISVLRNIPQILRQVCNVFYSATRPLGNNVFSLEHAESNNNGWKDVISAKDTWLIQDVMGPNGCML